MKLSGRPDPLICHFARNRSFTPFPFFRPRARPGCVPSLFSPKVSYTCRIVHVRAYSKNNNNPNPLSWTTDIRRVTLFIVHIGISTPGYYNRENRIPICAARVFVYKLHLYVRTHTHGAAIVWDV